MGVGFTTIMYGEESLLDGLADIGACRYDGVETSLGEIGTVGAEPFAEQLDAYNLDLYCTMGEWLETQGAADRIAAGAATAADLGAPYLGILPPHRGTTDDDDFERWLGEVCDAAADAGVDHFVYSSVGSADADTGLAHFESKWAVEQRIEELGLPATVMRPVFFMQNFAYMMRDDIMDGQLVMPLEEDVSLAVVDATDIGQAVVAALNDPDTFLGEVVTLAGDDLTLEEFAAAFSEQLGHEVEPVHADVEDYREMAGDELADMFQWFNDVGYDIDIPALAEWGLEMTSFEAYLADSDVWQPTSLAASN
jgi:hypothetical protein